MSFDFRRAFRAPTSCADADVSGRSPRAEAARGRRP